jgi:hypothetical protein
MSVSRQPLVLGAQGVVLGREEVEGRLRLQGLPRRAFEGVLIQKRILRLARAPYIAVPHHGAIVRIGNLIDSIANLIVRIADPIDSVADRIDRNATPIVPSADRIDSVADFIDSIGVREVSDGDEEGDSLLDVEHIFVGAAVGRSFAFAGVAVQVQQVEFVERFH